MKKPFYVNINVTYTLMLTAALLQTSVVSAQSSGVAAKLTSFRAWLDPILDIIIAIACVIFFVRLIISILSKSQDVGSKAAYFIVGLLLWAIKAVIFSDIASI